MASVSALTRQIRALDPVGVRRSFDESPALLPARDDRGRTWLHLCCSVDVGSRHRDVDASLAIADDLIGRGLDIDDAAFTEHGGKWRATPLWYSVARGQNIRLAEHLLNAGCDPNHTLWAAAFRNDGAAIDLLLDHGADIDPVIEDETPFLAAVKHSHFAAAWRLADRGADINFVDTARMTALHYMLKKSSAPEHFVSLMAYRPRLDVIGPDGRSAAAILGAKRDPRLRALATDDS